MDAMENKSMPADEMASLRQQYYNATLVWMREANPDLRVFRVKPDFALPAHQPGQYTTLGLGIWEGCATGCLEENPAGNGNTKLIRRAYSISSSIVDENGEFLDHEHADWLEFYVVLVRDTGGPNKPALTPRLFKLAEGDRLFLGEKITGRYTAADVKPDDTVLFLSTGTGEAPHNYMLWQLLKGGHTGAILSACCVRYLRDLAYLDVHQALAKRFANYSHVSLATREPNITQKVYIQDLISSGELEDKLGAALDPRNTHVFLCGNPNMIGVPTIDRKTGEKTYPETTGVIEILEKRGFAIDQPARKAKGNIHFEEYW